MVFFAYSCSKEERNPGDEDWSFVVFGDVQQGFGVYSMLAQNIGNLLPAPQCAFCCGDIMLRPANEVEWVNFWKVSEPITDKMKLYITRGNHEGNDPASERVLKEQLQLPQDHFYYSFARRNAMFIILDTEIAGEENSIGPEQFQWLNQALLAAGQASDVDHVFIFMHRPLFPQGQHSGSPLANRLELHDLFLEYPKIRAVFAGHEHMFNKYQRDGINYIITGGGGGVLYDGYGGNYHHFTKVSFYEESNRINIKTIGIFNETVEDFDL
ncbi:MAG: metallophosphoesterase [Bacteroidales bacterium]|nr:metallophosphoesterase [Bacteroidales bacterium]